MDSPDPLDPETLAQLRELGDDAFIGELAEMFLTDFDAPFNALLDAVAADDRETAASKAHFLKGSSMSIGLLTLSQTLAQIEQHFRGDAAAADLDPGVLAQLPTQADQARMRLRMLLLECEDSGISGR
ncbi:MAG: Hpt domain [Actinomycetota bacterium]|jgi:HPt (histidine-containing phosphotransfer) domain-containing protein